MKRIAMIKNGVVQNVALWDGTSEWSPSDFTLVEVTDLSEVGPGFIYSNGEFFAPVETE